MKATKLTFSTNEELDVVLSDLSVDSGLFLSMRLKAFGDYEYYTSPLKELIITHIRSRKRHNEVEDLTAVLNELLLEVNKVREGLLPECFNAPDNMPA